ncbi:MAG: LPS assembly protein LptD [Bdellovibrionales bacterium]|nr:LPS assembly protein LptD [Bdellovibrionales bacterium]
MNIQQRQTQHSTIQSVFLLLRLFLSLLFFFCQGNVWAQTTDKNSGLIVNADQMNSDFKAKTTQLKGNVQIIFQGQHLSSNHALIDYKNKRIVASGNVRLQSPTVYAEATRLTVNYGQETAVFENGFLLSGQVSFEGTRIEKTGPTTYVANDASYTACISCPPTWKFTGQKIEAQLGGYAKIKRPVLRLGGIPVLILPGLLVPLKTTRQSGFLVPSAEFSKIGGFAPAESFFWAISRNQDMTLTARNYELRGFKGSIEYRHMFSDQSYSHLQSGYLKDRAFTREYHLGNDVNRWYVNYEHYFLLPDNFIQRMRIRQISDLRYLRDFPDEMAGNGEPALENSASLTKNFSDQHFSFLTNYNVNLLQSYPLGNNDDSVQKFPEIRYSLLDKHIFGSPLLFRFDGVYTNFARNGFAYDDMNKTSCPGKQPHCATVDNQGQVQRDGKFNPNEDFIRTGQRLDLRPSVALPFQAFKFLDIVPEFTYHEMQYHFDINDSLSSNYGSNAAQRYLETNLLVRTSLSRVYGGNSSDPHTEKYKHEIEPEVSFSDIPWSRRSNHAFFGEFGGQRYARIFEPISDSDLYGKNRLQFDYNDRMFDKKLVELALNNKLTRKRWTNGSPTFEPIGIFRISQSYDFYEAKSTQPQPWSAINGLLNVHLDYFETYTSASYNPYAKVTNTSSRIKLFEPKGNFIQFTYERIFLIDENNKVTGPNQTENIGFGAGLKSKYLDLAGQIDYSSVTSQVHSWQYLAGFKLPGNCWTIQFGHKQIIGGEPNLEFNMFFNFGGEKINKVN